MESEPLLNYSQLQNIDDGFNGVSLPSSSVIYTSFCAAEKVLLVGTSVGHVHVLDIEGHLIKKLTHHNSAVNDLSLDSSSEYAAIGCNDGSISICALYSDDVFHFKSDASVTAISIDPRYSIRRTREFVYGTSKGRVVICSKGWLGNSETIIFESEKPIIALKRNGLLLAWLVDSGTFVYDMSKHACVGKLEFSLNNNKNSISFTTNCLSSCTSLDELSDLNEMKDTIWKKPNFALEWISRKKFVMSNGTEIVIAKVVDQEEILRQNANDTSSSRVANALEKENSSKIISKDFHLTSLVELISRYDIAHGLCTGIAPFIGTAKLIVMIWYPDAGKTKKESQSYSQNCEDTSENRTKSGTLLRLYDSHGREHSEDTLQFIEPRYLQTPAHLFFLSNESSQIDSRFDPTQFASNTSQSAERTNHSKRHVAWAQADEVIYYILGQKILCMGRPRTSQDRITWLAEHERYAEALAIARVDPEIPSSTFSELADARLKHLFDSGNLDQAALQCEELLGNDSKAWERWVYLFAQRAELPLLAPRLPVADPTLAPSVYDLALSACLRSEEHHSTLKKLVDNWPHDIYNAKSLLRTIEGRLPSSGLSPHSCYGENLLVVGAKLASILGEHELCLHLLLENRSKKSLPYVAQNVLGPEAAKNASKLIDIHSEEAIRFLSENWQIAEPHVVVASLQRTIKSIEAEINSILLKDNSMEFFQNIVEVSSSKVSMIPETSKSECRGTDEIDLKKQVDIWQNRLYRYLQSLWHQEPTTITDFSTLYIELCAKYEPGNLYAFLNSCNSYPLDQALDICKSHGLTKESIYVLGRMGCPEDALKLTVEELKDISAAVEFVQEHQDQHLGDILISLALRDATLAGELLAHTGGHIHPLQVLHSLPVDLEIEDLKGKIIQLMKDVRCEEVLQVKCNAAVQEDCLNLASALYCKTRCALRRIRNLDYSMSRQQMIDGVHIANLFEKTQEVFMTFQRPAS